MLLLSTGHNLTLLIKKQMEHSTTASFDLTKISLSIVIPDSMCACRTQKHPPPPKKNQQTQTTQTGLHGAIAQWNSLFCYYYSQITSKSISEHSSNTKKQA